MSPSTRFTSTDNFHTILPIFVGDQEVRNYGLNIATSIDMICRGLGFAWLPQTRIEELLQGELGSFEAYLSDREQQLEMLDAMLANRKRFSVTGGSTI